MQQQLINHSPDLKRLQDEGYEIVVNGGHLLVHHIPYLNSTLEVKYGTIVTVLNYTSPNLIGKPYDHTIYFCGETPYNADGTALTAIINNSENQQLSEDILVNHFFSSKPSIGYYDNYYDKVRTYSDILCSQVNAIDQTVTTKPKLKNQSEDGK